MFTELKIPAHRRRMTATESAVVAAAGVAFTLMVLFSIFEQFSGGRLSVVFVALFWAPMLILHEAGHAVAARLVGWRVREIVIGFGRELWRWQFRGIQIRVKLAPVEGYVLPEPRDARHIRLKTLIVYAAGPAAELLLLLLLLFIFGADYVFAGSDAIGQVAVQSLAIVILLGAGFNLLPFRSEGAVSDGLGILSSPFMSQAAIETRLLGSKLREIQACLARDRPEQALRRLRPAIAQFPQHSLLQQCLVVALAASGDIREAREIVAAKLGADEADPEEQMQWRRLQARIELEAAEPSWLTLDLAVQKILAVSPGDPGAQAIKGASLVLRGQSEAGGELLAEAWRRNDGSVSDAELLAYLAIAARRSRHVEAAARFRECFAQVNVSERLARRVAAAFGAAG